MFSFLVNNSLGHLLAGVNGRPGPVNKCHEFG